MSAVSRIVPIALFLTALLPWRSWAQEVDISGMSEQELLQDASRRVEGIEATLNEVFDLRDRTQTEDRDLTRVRCINDKMAAIQGFLRLSADSQVRLGEHVSRGDEVGTQHQYTLIVIASQRVQALQSEANQCAGDILTFSGETQQQVWVDPTIPETDLTAGNMASEELDRLMPEEPLPEATPFQ